MSEPTLPGQINRETTIEIKRSTEKDGILDEVEQFENHINHVDRRQANIGVYCSGETCGIAHDGTEVIEGACTGSGHVGAESGGESSVRTSYIGAEADEISSNVEGSIGTSFIEGSSNGRESTGAEAVYPEPTIILSIGVQSARKPPLKRAYTGIESSGENIEGAYNGTKSLGSSFDRSHFNGEYVPTKSVADSVGTEATVGSSVDKSSFKREYVPTRSVVSEATVGSSADGSSFKGEYVPTEYVADSVGTEATVGSSVDKSSFKREYIPTRSVVSEDTVGSSADRSSFKGEYVPTESFADSVGTEAIVGSSVGIESVLDESIIIDSIGEESEGVSVATSSFRTVPDAITPDRTLSVATSSGGTAYVRGSSIRGESFGGTSLGARNGLILYINQLIDKHTDQDSSEEPFRPRSMSCGMMPIQNHLMILEKGKYIRENSIPRPYHMSSATGRLLPFYRRINDHALQVSRRNMFMRKRTRRRLSFRDNHNADSKEDSYDEPIRRSKRCKLSGTYSSDTSYDCEHCGIGFKHFLMYTIHMGYHGFTDPLKCNICGYLSSNKVDFYLHVIRSAHP